MLELQRNHVLSDLTGAILRDYVIAKFQFQRLGSSRQRVSQLLEISGYRLCRLTTSLKNQKHKIQCKIFENIVDAADH